MGCWLVPRLEQERRSIMSSSRDTYDKLMVRRVFGRCARGAQPLRAGQAPLLSVLVCLPCTAYLRTAEHRRDAEWQADAASVPADLQRTVPWLAHRHVGGDPGAQRVLAVGV